MDVAVAAQMVFGILGGLAIFLLGMKNMSEGMQAVAGRRIRRAIKAVTNNRLVACGVGTGVTCVIQSSSVTTVMTVGMVSAGLMTLHQAIGIILGANIGTTITGWILAMKIGKYGLAILGVSAFFFLFAKRDRVRYTAMLFLGLGMVFYGLQLMETGFQPLRDMPEFKAWFSRFQADSYFGVLECVLVGAVLTAIVQSSSATVGITMGLASTGLISFPTAVALVLGENIGTTITAYLASIGGSVDARRASFAHIMVNVLGVAWITAVFPYYLTSLQWTVTWAAGTDPGTMVLENGVETFPYIAKGIALAHTGFNVVNVILFLPLIGLLARFLQWMVPDKTHKEIPHLRYLDIRMLSAPAIGIEQSMKEIHKMAEGVEKMLNWLKLSLQDDQVDEVRERKLFHREEVLDVVQKEIVEFLSHMLSGTVPQEVMDSARRQFRMADEYESISDYAADLLKLRLKIRKNALELSDPARKELLDLHDHVYDYVRFVNEGVRDEEAGILSKAYSLSDQITRLVKEYRNRHLARVSSGEASAQKSLVFTDMLNGYRRIRDHALNIAEVAAGQK